MSADRILIDGQLTEISRRPGTNTVFFVLRDPAADISLRVTAARQLIDAMGDQLTEGSRVVVWAKPEFYIARGTLQLHALEIRPVGVGELLARIERLKRVLAADLGELPVDPDAPEAGDPLRDRVRDCANRDRRFRRRLKCHTGERRRWRRGMMAG